MYELVRVRTSYRNVCNGDPWYALKLVETKDVTTGCYTRQSIARRINDTPNEQLTVNLVKWKRRHAQDLQQAATDGTLPPDRPLAHLLLKLREQSIADTANVESYDSIIKVWTERCPPYASRIAIGKSGHKQFHQELERKIRFARPKSNG